MSFFEMIEDLWSDDKSKQLLHEIHSTRPEIINSDDTFEKLKDMGLIVRVITKNPDLLHSHYELTKMGELVLQKLEGSGDTSQNPTSLKLL